MIKLETIYEGSTFYGAEIALWEDEIIPVELESANIIMHIKRKGEDEPVQIYSSENGKLTIENNVITIPEHKPTLEFGKYVFDFNIQFFATTETGVAGGEWEILNPVTHR